MLLPMGMFAQINGNFNSPEKSFGRRTKIVLTGKLYRSHSTGQRYSRLVPESQFLYETDYILACAAYELKDVKSINILESYLEKHLILLIPTGKCPYASVYFFNNNTTKPWHFFSLLTSRN